MVVNIVDISGEHVYVESGATVAISGQPVTISGDHVFVESGAHVIAQSGVHVVTDIEVDVSSGLHVQVSGTFVTELGMDYIKSGEYPACSGTHGQLEIPTVMQTLTPAIQISGWWACAEEARLFTGADAKHVRFHDGFQGTELDSRKWITTGTPAVTGGECRLMSSAIKSREHFLYGTLSCTVWSSNWQNVIMGFYTDDYPQGGDVIVAIDNSNFVTENVGTGTRTTTAIPLADFGQPWWYDLDFVWTPSYAQLWINGQLKVTHMTNIPNNPANIVFDASDQALLWVANASLKPYGDIPLVHRGAVPIAGAYFRDSGLLDMEFRPIRVCESGEIVVCSGLYVVADVEVDVSSGLHVLISGQPVTISGDHVFVESGTFVATQPDIGISGTVTVESGLHVQISGQHVYVESGVHVVTGVSGDPIQMTLIDLSGNIVAISKRHEGIVTTTDVTRETHKGNMYHVAHCQSGLEANSNLDMLMVIASGKELHARFGVAAGGPFNAWLFEKATVSDSGTQITAHNMNRVISGQCITLFSIGPTVTSTHTPLWCDVRGATQFKGAAPGTIRADTEWVLNGVSGNINYLLRINNRDATNAQDAQLQVEFSEEEPVFWA